MTDLPIIDLAGQTESSAAQQTVQAIHDSAKHTGFFYVKNHGVPQSVIDRAFSATEKFFSLARSVKSRVAVDANQRGWMAEGMSTMRGARHHDIKEVFFYGPDFKTDHPGVIAASPLVAVNQWPDHEFPELRKTILAYHYAVSGLGHRILEAVAVGFGTAPEFFRSRYREPLARGQLVYYPPAGLANDGQQRFGVAPHSDFGVLTLLMQDNSGGLRVKRRDGIWVEAPPIPGTFVCNIGNLLQRWSNDRLVSTVHAVVNKSGRKRFSMPVFFDPDSDAVVDPRDLPLLCSEQAKYPPVKTGEYIMCCNRKAFSQYR